MQDHCGKNTATKSSNKIFIFDVLRESQEACSKRKSRGRGVCSDCSMSLPGNGGGHVCLRTRDGHPERQEAANDTLCGQKAAH